MWQEFLYKGPAGSRPYFVYTPENYTVGVSVPLLVMLHGCTQPAEEFAYSSRMNHLAEQHNFLVVYPQQVSSQNRGLCWNWFSNSHQSHDEGEPAIIAGIVQEMEQQTAVWTIDVHRIYAAGISAGGAMAVILGATYPDIFAAIGVHSGMEYRAASGYLSGIRAMHSGGPNPVHQGQLAYRAMGNFARVIPTIVFHGARDKTVAMINGVQVAQQWMSANALAANGSYSPDFMRPSTIVTGQVPGGYAYTVSTWKDVSGKDIQACWIVDGLGHAWSGGQPPASFADPRGPDASQAMYDFFIQHPTGVDESRVSLWWNVRRMGGRLLKNLRR